MPDVQEAVPELESTTSQIESVENTNLNVIGDYMDPDLLPNTPMPVSPSPQSRGSLILQPSPSMSVTESTVIDVVPMRSLDTEHTQLRGLSQYLSISPLPENLRRTDPPPQIVGTRPSTSPALSPSLFEPHSRSGPLFEN
eukprot:CAMPEP_0196586378 /NCGR_PEP_ID=MMETSP1081-20130531/54059_1 /TAXON_ID=36882 /ORGANISM="Pyramimonas amylifera, Strain CCMP720" /LENGTH=139 /DNA_ID=CAMNT_0041908239 /DNA_START=43 /DNA_END=462 /DNA_ORIENTATION=-